ncbi:MAG TPA: NAD(P)H-hydrate dehydratase [Oligoflexus sp.]|uniref:NAD(P)H-hydrate epimerase n=1 Tax=Oligoflexus sp. TaxID=1971216 RepID=UPI002D30EADA|nr:NAD(P)H-hydrate dehydratase [Oligoflexus sp.]HYX33047.1 NAD(P)H-hydrate dehydratase [Oligoflexus sp.]
MIWAGQVARDIDHLTTTLHGVPSLDLMEEAGLGVARLAMEIWKPGLSILVVAGAGNNGGDALVAARYLKEAGFAPAVFDVRAADTQETPDRQTQRLRYEKLGTPCLPYRDAHDFSSFPSSTLIIDGLVGLGPKQLLRPGLVRQCLIDLRALKAERVLAIDLPSGMLADVWQPDEVLLPATHTITFGSAKLLHVLEPARSFCGELRIMPLPFHPEAIQSCLKQQGFHLDHDTAVLPRVSPWHDLPADAHKFTRGHLLIIGGSQGKLGAPLLAAEAAMRAGAGWVSVALLDARDRPALPRFLTYEDCGADPQKLLPFLRERRVKALVIGPGTMQNPLTPELLKALQTEQQNSGLFLVFDAGALKNWSTMARGLIFDSDRTLLTPHPGEWRAIDSSHSDLKNLESLTQAWTFCETFGVSVFYKSATPFTMASQNGRRFLLNTDGSRALGKAGSGDVLAGVAAAFGCAGRSAPLVGNEAQRAVAKAAQKAVLQWGRDGLGPEDLIQNLGQAFKE